MNPIFRNRSVAPRPKAAQKLQWRMESPIGVVLLSGLAFRQRVSRLLSCGGDRKMDASGAGRQIALYLLSRGARIDAFCAAMLGYRDMVLALLKTDPQTARIKGPHNLTLLYHAAISGDIVIAEAMKPLLPADAKDYDQSLSAAARDGRVEMTKWLLANGATNVNAPDGFRKTPLKIAIEKGYENVASVLRAHGGREVL